MVSLASQLGSEATLPLPAHGWQGPPALLPIAAMPGFSIPPQRSVEWHVISIPFDLIMHTLINSRAPPTLAHPLC